MLEPITILVVDNQRIVCRSIRALLTPQPDILLVGEACCGEDAIRIAHDMAPDVILIDLNLSGTLNSLETIRLLKHVSPCSQIAGMSTGSNDETVLAVMRAGALAYIVKHVRAGEMAAMLQTVARGEAILDQWIACRLLSETSNEPWSSISQPAPLSGHEREILALIAAGYVIPDIAHQLLMSEKTVRNHISNIVGKFQQADRTETALCERREILRREFFVSPPG
jgi:DNA-binding NarL/FixJ family response regulator